jgi:hypothetical protein
MEGKGKKIAGAKLVVGWGCLGHIPVREEHNDDLESFIRGRDIRCAEFRRGLKICFLLHLVINQNTCLFLCDTMSSSLVKPTSRSLCHCRGHDEIGVGDAHNSCKKRIGLARVALRLWIILNLG